MAALSCATISGLLRDRIAAPEFYGTAPVRGARTDSLTGNRCWPISRLPREPVKQVPRALSVAL